jgi:hypothetical protein
MGFSPPCELQSVDTWTTRINTGVSTHREAWTVHGCRSVDNPHEYCLVHVSTLRGLKKEGREASRG